MSYQLSVLPANGQKRGDSFSQQTGMLQSRPTWSPHVLSIAQLLFSIKGGVCLETVIVSQLFRDQYQTVISDYLQPSYIITKISACCSCQPGDAERWLKWWNCSAGSYCKWTANPTLHLHGRNPLQLWPCTINNCS